MIEYVLSSRFEFRPGPGLPAEIQLSSALDLRSKSESNSDLDLRSRSELATNSDLANSDLDLRSRFELRPGSGFPAEIQLSSALDLRTRFGVQFRPRPEIQICANSDLDLQV